MSHNLSRINKNSTYVLLKLITDYLYGCIIREKSCIFAVIFIVVKVENIWPEKEKTSTNEKMDDGRQDLLSLISMGKLSTAMSMENHTVK